MEIIINDTRQIGEIQEEFHSKFPNLQLVFFKHRNGEDEEIPEFDLVLPELTIGQARQRHNKGHVNIYPFQTVSVIEGIFENKFGLHARIRRKEGNRWLPAERSMELTLAEQNKVDEKELVE
jgi:hypothetical protein